MKFHPSYHRLNFAKESRLVFQDLFEGYSTEKEERALTQIEEEKRQLAALRKQVGDPNPNVSRHEPDDRPTTPEKKPETHHIDEPRENLNLHEIAMSPEVADRMNFSQEVFYRHYLDSAFTKYLLGERGLLAHVDSALEQVATYPHDLSYDSETKPGYIIITKHPDSTLPEDQLSGDLKIIIDPGSTDGTLEKGKGLLTEVNNRNLTSVGGKRVASWDDFKVLKSEFSSNMAQFDKILVKHNDDIRAAVQDSGLSPDVQGMVDTMFFRLPHRIKNLVEWRNKTMEMDPMQEKWYQEFLTEEEWHPTSLEDYKRKNYHGDLRFHPSFREADGTLIPDRIILEVSVERTKNGKKVQEIEWIGFSDEGYFLVQDTTELYRSYFTAENMPLARRSGPEIENLMDLLTQNRENAIQSMRQLAADPASRNALIKQRKLKTDITYDMKQLESYFLTRFSVAYNEYIDQGGGAIDDAIPSEEVDTPPFRTINFDAHPLKDRYNPEEISDEEPDSTSSSPENPLDDDDENPLDDSDSTPDSTSSSPENPLDDDDENPL